ncbi:hypothetical protein BHM03_00031596, partial [Ensete ventricosum]
DHEEATSSPHLRQRGEEEEATSHMRRPTREGGDGSGSSRESNTGSPSSPFSSFSLAAARLRPPFSGR